MFTRLKGDKTKVLRLQKHIRAFDLYFNQPILIYHLINENGAAYFLNIAF